MTHNRPASLVFISLLLVTALAAGYLAVSPSGRQEEETLPTSAIDRSAIPTIATVMSNVSQRGLQLVATIRPAEILQGQHNITVNAQVYDTVQYSAWVNTTSMANPARGPCLQSAATGVRLYEGILDRLADLNRAKELLLYDPSKTYTCPQISQDFQFQYAFDPYSNTITVNGKGSGHLNETSFISGYYVAGTGGSYTFNRLPIGYYTIEIFDAWRQEALAPVRVVASLPPTSGLELRLSDNASTLHVGQRLHVDISLFNALPMNNPLPAFHAWPFRGVPVALWPPCYSTGPIFDTPVYAVVLKGNYTAQQLQSAANVTISFMCMEAASIDLVTFQWNSSEAILHGYGLGPDPGPYQLSTSFTTNGYWDLLNNSKQPNPPVLGQQYPPGCRLQHRSYLACTRWRSPTSGDRLRCCTSRSYRRSGAAS